MESKPGIFTIKMAAKLEVHEICPLLIPQDSKRKRYDGYITARVSALYQLIHELNVENFSF